MILHCIKYSTEIHQTRSKYLYFKKRHSWIKHAVDQASVTCQSIQIISTQTFWPINQCQWARARRYSIHIHQPTYHQFHSTGTTTGPETSSHQRKNPIPPNLANKRPTFPLPPKLNTTCSDPKVQPVPYRTCTYTPSSASGPETTANSPAVLTRIRAAASGVRQHATHTRTFLSLPSFPRNLARRVRRAGWRISNGRRA